MHKQSSPPDERRQQTIAAVATFTTLMHAYERGELSTAAEAQGELERLGIVVRFVQPRARLRSGGRP